MIGETIIVYDDDLVDRAASKLAAADGYRYGRCGRCGAIAYYRRRFEAFIQALDAASQERKSEANTKGFVRSVHQRSSIHR